MSPSLSISILILVLISSTLASPSHASIETIEHTCMAAHKRSPDVNYHFCVTSLQADPHSLDADVKGLDIITIKLAKVNATATKAKIRQLAKENQEDQVIKEILDTCLSRYSDLFYSLEHSLPDVKSDKYGQAIVFLESAREQAKKCEDKFNEMNRKSLLTKENKNMQGLTAIAVAITRSLKGIDNYLIAFHDE